MLTAANEAGPYVLVAHSYGGFVSELHARTHPSDVVGMVMVDAASSRLRQAVSLAKLTVWDQTNRLTSPQSPEGVEVLDALAKLEAAGPMPQLPTIVLTADKPYRTDFLPPDIVDAGVTFADWLAAQDLLAPYLHAKHIPKTNSGHHVYLYSPQLVIDAIRDVVDLIHAWCGSTVLQLRTESRSARASNMKSANTDKLSKTDLAKLKKRRDGEIDVLVPCTTPIARRT